MKRRSSNKKCLCALAGDGWLEHTKHFQRRATTRRYMARRTLTERSVLPLTSQTDGDDSTGFLAPGGNV
jgi:hypothetical protein